MSHFVICSEILQAFDSACLSCYMKLHLVWLITCTSENLMSKENIVYQEAPTIWEP